MLRSSVASICSGTCRRSTKVFYLRARQRSASQPARGPRRRSCRSPERSGTSRPSCRRRWGTTLATSQPVTSGALPSMMPSIHAGHSIEANSPLAIEAFQSSRPLRGVCRVRNRALDDLVVGVLELGVVGRDDRAVGLVVGELDLVDHALEHRVRRVDHRLAGGRLVLVGDVEVVAPVAVEQRGDLVGRRSAGRRPRTGRRGSRWPAGRCRCRSRRGDRRGRSQRLPSSRASGPWRCRAPRPAGRSTASPR